MRADSRTALHTPRSKTSEAMFCADWALSFALWSALATWRPSLVTGEDTAATILPAAVLTGAAATALLFPFDFVRRMVGLASYAATPAALGKK